MRKLLTILVFPAILILTGCGSDATNSVGTATATTESPAEIVKKSSGSFTKTARNLFIEWAGKDHTLDSGQAIVTLSENEEFVSIQFDINVNEYIIIALHQGFLIGKDWLGGSYSDPVNPYCDEFQNDLVSYSLSLYHRLNLPMPTRGIYVTLNRHSTSESIDKYGNASLNREELSDVKFGISISDYKKINWEAESIDLSALSTLIPYTAADVSYCDSRVVAGGIKGL